MAEATEPQDQPVAAAEQTVENEQSTSAGSGTNAAVELQAQQDPSMMYLQQDMNGFEPQVDPNMVANFQQSMVPTMQPLQLEPISADEIALYDRQIRLWGVEAQQLIRNANVLLIGMKALGNEIAKNLVLAGIGTLTILDDGLVAEEDLGSQFLISQDDVGSSRAEAAASSLRKMNPRVNLYTDTDSLLTKLPEYFSTFNITICTNVSFDLATQINFSCRMYNAKFYAADTHGIYGYIFSDLILHNFMIEKKRGNIATKVAPETMTRTVLAVNVKRDSDTVIETVTKQEAFTPLMLANSSPLPPDVIKTKRSKMRVPPLVTGLRALFDFQKAAGGRLPGHTADDLRAFAQLANQRHLELELPMETLSAQFLRKFIQNLGSELSPVCAFLGGQLAQDVINVLGQREQPLQNFMVFDGDEFKGPVYSLHPFNDPNIAQLNGNGSSDELVSDPNGDGLLPSVGGQVGTEQGEINGESSAASATATNTTTTTTTTPAT